MTLADAPPPEETQPGPWCSMGEWMRSLDDADRAAAQGQLDGPAGHKALWRWFVRHTRDADTPTFDVSDQTMTRHRLGECRKCRG